LLYQKDRDQGTKGTERQGPRDRGNKGTGGRDGGTRDG
jgi:hypothetical protein